MNYLRSYFECVSAVMLLIAPFYLIWSAFSGSSLMALYCIYLCFAAGVGGPISEALRK